MVLLSLSLLSTKKARYSLADNDSVEPVKYDTDTDTAKNLQYLQATTALQSKVYHRKDCKVHECTLISCTTHFIEPRGSALAARTQRLYVISQRDLRHCSCHQPTGQLHTSVPGGWEKRSLRNQPDWAQREILGAIPVNVLIAAQQWQVCSIMRTDGTGREAQVLVFVFDTFLKWTPLFVIAAPVLLRLMCAAFVLRMEIR